MTTTTKRPMGRPPTRPRREGPCRHCGDRRLSLRPRGLCYRCHADPAVRGLYPSWLQLRCPCGARLPPCPSRRRPLRGISNGLCFACRAGMSKGMRQTTTLIDLVLAGGVDPRRPTCHGPGTAGKIAVLESRLAAGLPLWVKGDARGNLK